MLKKEHTFKWQLIPDKSVTQISLRLTQKAITEQRWKQSGDEVVPSTFITEQIEMNAHPLKATLSTGQVIMFARGEYVITQQTKTSKPQDDETSRTPESGTFPCIIFPRSLFGATPNHDFSLASLAELSDGKLDPRYFKQPSDREAAYLEHQELNELTGGKVGEVKFAKMAADVTDDIGGLTADLVYYSSDTVSILQR